MSAEEFGYEFSPLPDITTYELAQIMAIHILRISDVDTIKETLSESCMRHLKLFIWDCSTGTKEYV